MNWWTVKFYALGQYGGTCVGIGLGTLFLKYINSYFPVFALDAAQIMRVPNTLDPDAQGVTEVMMTANTAAINNAVGHNNWVLQNRNNLTRDAARAVRGNIEETRPKDKPIRPMLKIDMPDYYEGDPTQIAHYHE